MSASEAAQPAVGASLTGRGRTIATLVVLLAFFMDILDSTIVNVAIPSIRDEPRRELFGDPVDHRRLLSSPSRSS